MLFDPICSSMLSLLYVWWKEVSHETIQPRGSEIDSRQVCHCCGKQKVSGLLFFCVHLHYCLMCLSMTWFWWHTISYTTSKSYTQCNRMTLASIKIPWQWADVYECQNVRLAVLKRRLGFHTKSMAAMWEKKAFLTKHTTCSSGLAHSSQIN